MFPRIASVRSAIAVEVGWIDVEEGCRRIPLFDNFQRIAAFHLNLFQAFGKYFSKAGFLGEKFLLTGI